MANRSHMIHSEDLILQTDRLIIKPLRYEQLLCYVRPDNSLEDSLGLFPYPRTLPEELKEALEALILPQVATAGDNYLYATLWTMIDRKKSTMVGDLCFKGTPNEHGEIEIGYGTYADFQGRGFMTEAVGAMAAWALEQPSVRAILAETDADNIPSHRTLAKNGFTVFRQIENMIWWRRDRR